MNATIYALLDPRDNKVRYVGKSNSISARLRAHIAKAKKQTKTHRDAWIRGLIAIGMKPVALILDVVSQEEWQEREVAWIATLRKTEQLTNIMDGGEGGAYTGFRSKEWGEKISIAKTGRRLSPEHAHNSGNSWRGKKQPAEMSEKKRASMMGKNSTVTAFGLISPDGECFPAITNLTAFARERGLSQGHLHSVGVGERDTHRGWRKL